MNLDDILNAIPDPGHWEAYASWFAELEHRAAVACLREQGPNLVSVGGGELELPTDPCGRFHVARYRRFLGALLAADWLTYTAPDDRVNLLRLGFALDRFPEGFRVWFASDASVWMPVGYSGWYPIDAPTFERFKTNKPPWRDRAVVPMTTASRGDFLFLFNYSILPSLRRAEGSRRLLRQLALEIEPVHSRGMVAITVSNDGSRVAQHFGLSYRYPIQVGESSEEIWLSESD